MKIILTGASGWIGGQALKQCISDPRITQIVILVRRPLTNPPPSTKLTTVIVEDFNNYSPTTLSAISDADAAIWAMGTRTSGDPVVEIEYPTTFFKAITSSTAFKRRTTPFRFSYVGGAFTVPDQEKSLWFLSVPRKSRGLAQTVVLGFADAQEAGGAGNWETVVVRPGGVFTPWEEAGVCARVGGWMAGSGLTAWNDELGVVLVEIAVRGGGEERVVSSRRIAELAGEIRGR